MPFPAALCHGASDPECRRTYPSVPGAARRHPMLYELLALVDALRLGRARERGMAEKEIAVRLNRHVAA